MTFHIFFFRKLRNFFEVFKKFSQFSKKKCEKSSKTEMKIIYISTFLRNYSLNDWAYCPRNVPFEKKTFFVSMNCRTICPRNVVKNVHEMSSTPCRVFELYSRYASYFGRKGASKSLVWLWKFLRWKYLLLFIWWQKWKHSKECQKYLS